MYNSAVQCGLLEFGALQCTMYMCCNSVQRIATEERAMTLSLRFLAHATNLGLLKIFDILSVGRAVLQTLIN